MRPCSVCGTSSQSGTQTKEWTHFMKEFKAFALASNSTRMLGHRCLCRSCFFAIREIALLTLEGMTQNYQAQREQAQRGRDG